MSVYRILTTTDPSLREKSREVTNINNGVFRLLDNLMDTLKASEDGAGLAAPQIGVPKRIILINLEDEEQDNYIEMINPEILEREGDQTNAEGCLSVPGIIGWVNRAKKVKVRAMDRKGQSFELEAVDFGARLIQHEIDHLDGILFIDKATRTKRVD